MTIHLQDAVLRFPDVRKATGLSRATIYRMELAGKFPSRVSIGIRSVGWRASDVSAWISERAIKRGCA